MVFVLLMLTRLIKKNKLIKIAIEDYNKSIFEIIPYYCIYISQWYRIKQVFFIKLL